MEPVPEIEGGPKLAHSCPSLGFAGSDLIRQHSGVDRHARTALAVARRATYSDEVYCPTNKQHQAFQLSCKGGLVQWDRQRPKIRARFCLDWTVIPAPPGRRPALAWGSCMPQLARIGVGEDYAATYRDSPLIIARPEGQELFWRAEGMVKLRKRIGDGMYVEDEAKQRLYCIHHLQSWGKSFISARSIHLGRGSQ